LRATLDELNDARTNGQAADIHERIGILMESHGEAMLAVVEAAKAVSDSESIEEARTEGLAALLNLDAALARLYAGSEGEDAA